MCCVKADGTMERVWEQSKQADTRVSRCLRPHLRVRKDKFCFEMLLVILKIKLYIFGGIQMRKYM